MKLNIGKHKVEFFDSIDNLPFNRFNAFNKFVMLDSKLGSTVFDFDKTTVRIYEFIDKEMLEEAKAEMLNLRITVNNILTENSPKTFAFMSMIKSIDGKKLNDYSEENLLEWMDKFSENGLTIKEVTDTITEVKKK